MYVIHACMYVCYLSLSTSDKWPPCMYVCMHVIRAFIYVYVCYLSLSTSDKWPPTERAQRFMMPNELPAKAAWDCMYVYVYVCMYIYIKRETMAA